MRDRDTILLEQAYRLILETKDRHKKNSIVQDIVGFGRWEWVDRQFFPCTEEGEKQAEALVDSFEFGGNVRYTRGKYLAIEIQIPEEDVREYARRTLAGEKGLTLPPKPQIPEIRFENIKNLKAESSHLMYDFGGSESIKLQPQQATITDIVVVDKSKPRTEELEDANDKTLYFVKANLFAPITLPKPAQEIYVGKLFRYARVPQEINALVDNIDRHLLKGGTLSIFEDSDEDSGSNYEPLMNRLIQTFETIGYTLIKTESINSDKIEMTIFRK